MSTIAQLTRKIAKLNSALATYGSATVPEISNLDKGEDNFWAGNVYSNQYMIAYDDAKKAVTSLKEAIREAVLDCQSQIISLTLERDRLIWEERNKDNSTNTVTSAQVQHYIGES
jgi:5-methylthioribose kinase